MGYDTRYYGELKFTCKKSDNLSSKIEDIICAGIMELCLTDDEDGIECIEDAIVEDIISQINKLISEVKKDFPDFGLEGTIETQGEEYNDYCLIKMEEGFAVLYEGEIIYKKAENKIGIAREKIEVKEKTTKYLLSSERFRLNDEAIITLYKQGSKFVEVDRFGTIERLEREVKRDNDKFREEGTLEDLIKEFSLVLYNSNTLYYKSNTLESRSCPLLLKLVEEWGVDGVAREEDKGELGIVEVPSNNVETELHGFDCGGDYICEKHKIFFVEDK